MSPAEMMRKMAAQACEQQERGFLDPQYATGQPFSSILERFGCRQCAEAIRALPIPADPRDAEIARLRAALTDMLDAVDDLIAHSGGVYGLHLNGDGAPWGSLVSGGQFENWLGLPMDAARAALAQSGETQE